MKRIGSPSDSFSNPTNGDQPPLKRVKIGEGSPRDTKIRPETDIISQKTISDFEIETPKTKCENNCSDEENFIFKVIGDDDGFQEFSTVPKNVKLSQKNMNSTLELSNDFKLEFFELRDVNKDVTITLANSFSKLQKLSIGTINGKINLPELSNIHTFDIHCICDTEIQIPIQLPNGSKKCVLKIGTIFGKVQITFTTGSHCPIELRIECIKANSNFELIDSSNKLKLFAISKIEEDAKISFPNCENCDIISFKKEPLKFTYNLPSVFDKCASDGDYDHIFGKTSKIDRVRYERDRVYDFATNQIDDLCEKGIWQKGKEIIGNLPNLLKNPSTQLQLTQDPTVQSNLIQETVTVQFNSIHSSIVGAVFGIQNFFCETPIVKEEIQVDLTKITEDRKQLLEQEAQKRKEKLRPIFNQLLSFNTSKPKEEIPDQTTGAQSDDPIILD